MFICECPHVYMCSVNMPGTQGDWKRVPYPLELELEVVLSNLMWVLGTHSHPLQAGPLMTFDCSLL